MGSSGFDNISLLLCFYKVFLHKCYPSLLIGHNKLNRIQWVHIYEMHIIVESNTINQVYRQTDRKCVWGEGGLKASCFTLLPWERASSWGWRKVCCQQASGSFCGLQWSTVLGYQMMCNTPPSPPRSDLRTQNWSGLCACRENIITHWGISPDFQWEHLRKKSLS